LIRNKGLIAAAVARIGAIAEVCDNDDVVPTASVFPAMEIRIILRDDGAPNRRHKACVPLRTEASAASSGFLCDPFVVLQIFGNGNFPRLPGAHFVVDQLQETPAVGKVAALGGWGVDDRIEPEAVEPVFVQPLWLLCFSLPRRIWAGRSCLKWVKHWTGGEWQSLYREVLIEFFRDFGELVRRRSPLKLSTLQKRQRIKKTYPRYTQAAKLVPRSKSGGFGRGKDWRERAAVSAIG
jgi:hypothetical protein